MYIQHNLHDLESTLLESLEERRLLQLLLGVSTCVVDTGLILLHARHVIVQRSHLLTALGGVVSQKLGNLGSVGGILVNTQLEILREGLVELLELLRVGILRNLREEGNALLDEITLDHTKNLVLLKTLTRNVQRKIFRIDDSLDERQPLYSVNCGVSVDIGVSEISE